MCREPFQAHARWIMQESMFDDLEGYVTAHSLTDLFYIPRKDFSNSPVQPLLPEAFIAICQKGN